MRVFLETVVLAGFILLLSGQSGGASDPDSSSLSVMELLDRYAAIQDRLDSYIMMGQTVLKAGGTGSVVTYNHYVNSPDPVTATAVEAPADQPVKKTADSSQSRQTSQSGSSITYIEAPSESAAPAAPGAENTDDFDEWFNSIFAEEVPAEGQAARPVGGGAAMGGGMGMGGGMMGGISQDENPEDQTQEKAVYYGGARMRSAPPPENSQENEEEQQ